MSIGSCCRFFTALAMSLMLTACAEGSGDVPTFQKAQGSDCVDQVIAREYLVRKRDGSLVKVHAENDEQFLEEYFEPNKEDIQTAEPNYRLSIEGNSPTPNGGTDNWGTTAIRADTYWSKGVYGQGVTVAVIDTGVDLNHSQLENRILVNLGESGMDANGMDKRFNGKDDDQNGYADDWKGFDFFHGVALFGDNKDHGSHVAGIIAGEHGDPRLKGVAPEAKILPIAFLGPDGSGALDDAIEAINYAVRRGAKVINASWGGRGCSITLKNEVRALADKDVLFVSAAGNSGRNLDLYPEYPSSFEGLTQITVGSIDSNFLISSFSNFSRRFVNLFAPGGLILSTIPGNSYATFSGTSMATPFVSGAAALIWSHHPDMTALEVKAALLKMVAIEASFENQTSGRLELSFE